MKPADDKAVFLAVIVSYIDKSGTGTWRDCKSPSGINENRKESGNKIYEEL